MTLPTSVVMYTSLVPQRQGCTPTAPVKAPAAGYQPRPGPVSSCGDPQLDAVIRDTAVYESESPNETKQGLQQQDARQNEAARQAITESQTCKAQNSSGSAELPHMQVWKVNFFHKVCMRLMHNV